MRALEAVAHQMSGMRWKEKPKKRGLTRIPGAYSNDIGGILPGPAKLNSENEDISQIPTKKEKVFVL